KIGSAARERPREARAHADGALAEEGLAQIDDVRAEFLEAALRIGAAPAGLGFRRDDEGLVRLDEEEIAEALAADLARSGEVHRHERELAVDADLASRLFRGRGDGVGFLD